MDKQHKSTLAILSIVACSAFCQLEFFNNRSIASEQRRGKDDSAATRNRHRHEEEGKVLFKANGCFDCHSINGAGCSEGVSLSSVALRREREFIAAQLKDPDKHVLQNKKAFNSEPNLMTNPNLSPQEAELIVSYLLTLRKPLPQRGQKSKYYNQL